MTRLTKQVVYGILYCVVFALIGTFVYASFFRGPASCTNGRQDVTEEGVDCGRVCGTLCLPASLQALQSPEEARIFHPSSGRVALLAKIQNPNADHAASEFQYRFDFYAQNGDHLGSQMGRSYIYASEIKQIAAFIDRDDASSITEARLTLLNPKWAKADSYARPNVAVQDRSFAGEGGALKVTGRLVNNDSLGVPEAVVIAVFLGRNDSPLGVSQTRVSDLASGESREFSITHPSLPDAIPGRTQIFVAAGRP